MHACGFCIDILWLFRAEAGQSFNEGFIQFQKQNMAKPSSENCGYFSVSNIALLSLSSLYSSNKQITSLS
jgi:hypothetical protein